MKTRHCVFPTGITAYEHEPYTRQDVLEYEGRWYVCGTGRQPLQRDKTASGGYYLLTLAAIAKELRQRGIKGRCSVILAAGLPLTGFGREKEGFEKYLRRSSQPVQYRYEDGVPVPGGRSSLYGEAGRLRAVFRGTARKRRCKHPAETGRRSGGRAVEDYGSL